jgi:hypothetical protein
MLGLGSISKKIFGTPNDRKVKATRPIVEAINALEPEFQALTDEGIKQKTEDLAVEALMIFCQRRLQTVAKPPSVPLVCGRLMCSLWAGYFCTKEIYLR